MSYPQTDQELKAGVTPVNTEYPPGDVRRYGARCDEITDDTLAVRQALQVAGT